jgi:hypothetical protein
VIRKDLIKDMEKSVEAISKWLRQSGKKLNECKTEMCIQQERGSPILNLNW